jgi:hypothetical protein
MGLALRGVQAMRSVNSQNKANSLKEIKGGS